MNAKPFLLLLNESLKDLIVSIPPADKKRLGEKLEFLENGMWDTGVRVKKLHRSSGQVVFEARLNRGDRLLFTLGREDERSLIYVWGIHHHDDINKGADRIGLPPNASFLFFDSNDTEDLPDLIIDDLPREYMTQEAIHERADTDCGPQKWLIADGEELDRLLRSGAGEDIELFLHITEEQKDILRCPPPLLISGTAGSGKTTISVYYLLQGEDAPKKLFLTCSPHLKRFSERIYDGLVMNRAANGTSGGLEDAEKTRPEFFTFREILDAVSSTLGKSMAAEKEIRLPDFAEIFYNHPLARKYDAELVWEEIRSIVKGATPSLSARRLRVLAEGYLERKIRPREVSELCGYLLSIKALSMVRKIDRVRERKTEFSDYDAFVQALETRPRGTGDSVRLLLEQTVHQVQARAAAFDRPILNLADYEYLGKKRAPSFLYDRRDIYSIAEYYQQKIEETGRWDEIDLTRAALEELSKGQEIYSYDLVVCDEIQDLADIQLSFLFRLAKHPSGLILTGDPKQIINPSGFRWEEVRNRFYERGVDVPDVFNLNLNFRCVGSIVRLANALLDLKQRTIGISGLELREEWKFNGRPPYLLHGMEDADVLKTVTLSGAGRIILTRSDAERDRLKDELATEMVFTINEAKGLEFDTVLLWRFTETGRSAGVWRRICQGEPPRDSNHPHIRHEINLLYVAVTRSRNTLIIYDGVDQADVWRVEEIAPHLFPSEEISSIEEAWRHVSTPDEWERQGDYFYERRFYRHAAECYMASGSKRKEQLAEAAHFRVEKRFAEAAPLFEKLGETVSAAECYEQAGIWKTAADLYGASGKTRRREICTAKLLEQSGRWIDAATLWEKLDDAPQARAALKRGGDFMRLAELCLADGDTAGAAEHFERAKDFLSAAACHERIKDYAQAAKLHVAAGNFEGATPLYRRLGDIRGELKCLQKLRRYYEAGALFEKSKDLPNVVEYYRKFAGLGEENRRKLLAEAQKSKQLKWKAAVRFDALGMYGKAAEYYKASRLVREAADAYINAEKYEEAADCLSRNFHYKEAVAALEAADEPDYDLVSLYLRRYTGKADRQRSYYRWNYERMNELRREIAALMRKKSYEAALARAKAIDDDDLIADLYELSGKNEEAFKYFLASNDYLMADEYFDEIDTYDFDLEFITELAAQQVEQKNMYQIPREMENLETLSATFLRALDLLGSGAVGNVINRWLTGLRWFLHPEIDAFPQQFIDLIVRLKSYNTLANLFIDPIDTRNKIYSEPFMELAEEIRDVGIETGDRSMTACASIVLSPKETNTILEEISCTASNVDLFKLGPRYREAVAIYLEENREDDALRACRLNGDKRLLASVYEKLGKPQEAARELLADGLAEDALKISRSEGDEVGMARAYDRLGMYDKAIEIWDRRGNKRDANRMRKKLGGGTPAPKKFKQLDLFD